MATNSQGSSHRPRAVGFRLQQYEDFIYESPESLILLTPKQNYLPIYKSILKVQFPKDLALYSSVSSFTREKPLPI